MCIILLALNNERYTSFFHTYIYFLIYFVAKNVKITCLIAGEYYVPFSLLQCQRESFKSQIIKYKACCFYCSVIKSCPTLCNNVNCSTPGFYVLYYLLGFAQIHVHWVGDAIQPFYPLLPTLSPALNLY